MKIALVHDYLAQQGGAEQVPAVLRELWPDAPLFSLLADRSRMDPRLAGGDLCTSFLSRIPFSSTRYRWLMPLMPAATESFDLTGFDVVLSSTSAYAKGVITDPGTVHICYCHNPPRYLWSNRHEYMAEAAPAIARTFMPLVAPRLRAWDRAAADRVDHFIANSRTVADRIRKYYGRDAEVIHPPVDTALFAKAEKKDMGTYFIAGGRLVAYKKFPLLVDTFNSLGIPLKIFGSGPELSKLTRRAWKNVQLLGRVSDAELATLQANAVAYVHPQEEDFGITAAEAMAAGTPVIAYRKGGATETVIDGVTGAFFDAQTKESLSAVIRSFDRSRYDSAQIALHAKQFDKEVFKEKIAAFVRRVTG